MQYEELIRKHRKRPMARLDELPVRLDEGRDAIARIIPHRDPFLLLDRLTGLDPEREMIAGRRVVSADEDVFRGHFPDYPVYPGTLQVEMVGQLGLCLWYFLSTAASGISADARPVDVRATRILGAAFLEPVPPGSELDLIAQKTEHDGFFARMIGQVIVGGRVATVAAGEVVFLAQEPGEAARG